MKKSIIIIIVLFFASFAFASDADAVFHKIVKEYQLNPDGSITFNYSKKVEFLTYYSFHRLYGETFIIYNPDFQTLKINDCHTVMADGKVIKAPENAFNEVLPSFARNNATVNKLREMVVTHTGLEKKAVVNLDYTIETQAGYWPALMGDLVLEEASPVKELVVRVKVPKGTKLQHRVFNLRTGPEETEEKGFTVYTWTFYNLKASSKESHQNHSGIYKPRLVFHTGGDLQRLYDRFMNQEAFLYKTDKSMEKKVDELLKDEKDETVKALKLQKYVASALNGFYVPLRYTGYKVQTPVQTWNRNGGTQLEKAALLTAMLRYAGIKADPVVAIPELLFDRKADNLEFFHAYYVQINPSIGNRYYLDPSQTAAFDHAFKLGGNKLLVMDPAIESLKTYDAMTNMDIPVMFEMNLTGNLTKDNKGRAALNGMANGNYYPKFSELLDTDAPKAMFYGMNKKQLSDVTDSDVLMKEGQFMFDVNAEGALRKLNDKYHVLALPSSKYGVESWGFNRLLSERKAPLEIPFQANESYTYELNLEEGMKYLGQDVRKEASNKVGEVFVQYTVKGQKVQIVKRIKFNKKIIMPTEYADFKAIMDIWNDPNYKKVLVSM